jgi:hypothetical protein
MTKNYCETPSTELEQLLKEKNASYEAALKSGESHAALLEIYKEIKAVQFELTERRINAVVA